MNSNPSVLVVDDNPLILNVLKGLLQSEQYHVFTSANGEEALRVLQGKLVDVIICDVMMPRMDGYKFHDAVRSKSELAHIPFIFLTALGEDSERVRGVESGADDYVVKPFDPKTLLSVVKGKALRAQQLKGATEKQHDAYRKRVIHTLSHEFRTPLVAINTGTELLMDQKDKLDREKVQHLLEAIKRGGQRLERLVTDFMLLQQIEAGIAQRMYTARAAAVDFAAYVAQYVESHREAVEGQGFALSFVNHCGGTGTPYVKIYEAQVNDILDRILDNAMKFSNGDNRTIELVLCPHDGEVALEVRDRGIGIDADRVREAIDIFGQIDRQRLEQQGGGLGLAIANRYLNIHQGRLELEPRQGGGSVVTVILPPAETEA